MEMSEDKKRRLDDEDFPLEAEKTKVTSKDGETVVDAETPGLAQDVTDRLNEDAARRHEDNWSA
jgi:hypothetical protein